VQASPAPALEGLLHSSRAGLPSSAAFKIQMQFLLSMSSGHAALNALKQALLACMPPRRQQFNESGCMALQCKECCGQDKNSQKRVEKISKSKLIKHKKV
jgi:hypothetical protein